MGVIEAMAEFEKLRKLYDDENELKCERAVNICGGGIRVGRIL